jgi:alkylation response protein AidB-like acyl-CoA dehydrogenase
MTDTGEISERQAREVAEQSRESQWLQPSFGKELFLGRLRLDLLHPPPGGSPDAAERGEAFLARLREFCESRVDAAVIERDARIPDEVILGLKDLGALGMKIDTEYGGLGLSQLYYCKALALVCSVHTALGALLSAHQSIGVPQPITMFGTDEQKHKWLPRCTQEISAFLLTEPDVGSDPARMHATATPDGDDYVLDGIKLWTTNGVIADLMVVMAKVPKSEDHPGGITAFVVESNTPGVVVENRNEFMGLRGIENGLTRLTDVRVPAANRIGKEGDGLRIALSTLNVGRLSLPACCCGTAKWCLKIAREWSCERVQWGRPVGKHDAVAGKVAFIAATAYGLEAMVELASELADSGQTDIRIEAALAKLYAAAAASRPPSRWPRGASAECRPNRCCAICASTGSSRAQRKSCICSSHARRWMCICPWPATSSSRKPICGARHERPRTPAGSTLAGCPAYWPEKANCQHHSASSDH